MICFYSNHTQVKLPPKLRNIHAVFFQNMSLNILKKNSKYDPLFFLQKKELLIYFILKMEKLLLPGLYCVITKFRDKCFI